MADNIIIGKDVLLYFLKNDEYLPFICAEEVSIDILTETKPVKTVGDGAWSRVRGQKLGYTVTLSGLIKFDDPDNPTAFDIVDYQIGFTDIQYRLIFENVDTGTVKVFEGTMLPTQSTLSGGSTDFADSTFSFVGNGPFDLRDTVDTCTATIGAGPLAVTVGIDGLLSVNTVTGGPVMRYDWTIDGGGINSAYSNTWYVATGSHTVVITPICENGLEGPQRIVTYSN